MTVRHVCPLCEATCGLELTLDGDRVVSVRGDADDVFSKGFVCPKGVAIGDLHHDPARLRAPLVRVDGELREATWDEAFDRIREGLRTVIGESGPNAVALYLGNPNSHNVTSTFYLPALVRALATRYRFSASTVDQMPQQVALGLMYGTELSVPVPDIDRTDLFVVIGGNPLVSNGSLMTVPDMPGRVRALRARGGRMIVVDPVRTRTAAAADEHLAIRPGTDVLLLAAMVNVLFAEGLVTMGAAEPWVRQEEVFRVGELLSAFTPEAVSDPTGLSASAIVTLAREVATAESAAVYGRMGTSTSALNVAGEPTSFGTLASWLIALLNLLTGNLDRPGGVMFPLPPAGGPTTFGEPGRGRGVRIPGSQRTRVRGLPSALGEFPVAALAEEIDTPDPDTGERVRALITVAGNPVVSTPDADRLELALGELDLLICLDAYVTETSRHADVILPAPSPLARDHYDVVFASLAVRNTARWSPAVFPLGETERDEGETLLRLAAIAASVVNGVPEPTVEQMDDLVAFEVARRVGDPAELLAAVAPRRGVPRLLDLSLRGGPYADLDLAALEAAPAGVDLGPLTARMPEVLRTPTGRIEVFPEPIVDEIARLVDALPRVSVPDLALVGRRQLRTNNSWLRTLPRLAGGSSRATLQVHPDDAERAGVGAKAVAVLTSDSGSVEVVVEVTDAVRPGVVCLPHGWSQADAWTADATRGPNVNVLTPATGMDPLSGTAVLNAVPVTLTAR
ncbi:MAG TPA: molybdopterin-dependent oxidoreductase [Actinomycetota bacterium]|nr:molybdopterin-dependent oxidoreductase [Actinomycetota bacterium]MCB8996882.1 molybdopterin-dependent oxidoreductase [Actinomycetota bacterium]MCB9424275.1 molybdopterin-dependent oxidoreductase [Actinomycetota bacterium]TXH44188.1 MAG: molybdopterin oxidoreductase family protein [Actinomycetota bacterium]HNE87832.1 molybdopterin-dependent oxidoreductase [Actinomycetota bacterium]